MPTKGCRRSSIWASGGPIGPGGLPLPLGGNIIRRDLGPEMIRKVSKMLHDSIAYALSHRREAVEYAQQFGRGLDADRTDTFVGMYVNDLTLGYGERGRQGVERLHDGSVREGPDPQARSGRVRRSQRATDPRTRIHHVRRLVPAAPTAASENIGPAVTQV